MPLEVIGASLSGVTGQRRRKQHRDENEAETGKADPDPLHSPSSLPPAFGRGRRADLGARPVLVEHGRS